MVIFEQVFRDLLIQTNLVANRAFFLRAPQVPAEQQKTPYMVFFHVGPEPLHAHSGPLGLLQRTYQVSIFDVGQTRAIAIADSLRGALDGYRGEYEGVLFGLIAYRNQTSEHEQLTKLFHVVQEYRILYRLTDHVQPAAPNRNTNRKESPHGNRSFGTTGN